MVGEIHVLHARTAYAATLIMDAIQTERIYVGFQPKEEKVSLRRTFDSRNAHERGMPIDGNIQSQGR